MGQGFAQKAPRPQHLTVREVSALPLLSLCCPGGQSEIPGSWAVLDGASLQLLVSGSHRLLGAEHGLCIPQHPVAAAPQVPAPAGGASVCRVCLPHASHGVQATAASQESQVLLPDVWAGAFPACSAPVLAYWYCSPALPWGCAGSSTLNLACTLVRLATGPLVLLSLDAFIKALQYALARLSVTFFIEMVALNGVPYIPVKITLWLLQFTCWLIKFALKENIFFLTFTAI